MCQFVLKRGDQVVFLTELHFICLIACGLASFQVTHFLLHPIFIRYKLLYRLLLLVYALLHCFLQVPELLHRHLQLYHQLVASLLAFVHIATSKRFSCCLFEILLLLDSCRCDVNLELIDLFE